MEYHSGGSLPLLGRPRYCPGANANGGYLCETGHCCGETGCCTYYYELWWFWLLWTVLILFSCCCAYRHRRAKLRVQQQQRQREISLLAYHGANSYPSSMLDLSFLASLKLPSYEEVAAQPSTPPPPYSSVFTTPRYPQPPRAADPHLLTQHDPLLHRPLSDGPSSLSSDNSSSCSCDSCCPSSPCSSSLSAPVTYETDTSHATTPGEAPPLAFDVAMETIAAAAACLEANGPRPASERTVGVHIGDEDAAGAREPDAEDSLVAGPACPQASADAQAALPVVTARPVKRQLDCAACAPTGGAGGPVPAPGPLPCFQTVSTEGSGPETTPDPMSPSESGPCTPTASTSERPAAAPARRTLDPTRTFAADAPRSPNAVRTPDAGRTLALMTDSAGPSSPDTSPRLAPILAPLNVTQLPDPVPTNLSSVSDPVLIHLTRAPDPAPSNLTLNLHPKLSGVPDRVLQPDLTFGSSAASLAQRQFPELSPRSDVAPAPPGPASGSPLRSESTAALGSRLHPVDSGPSGVSSPSPDPDLPSPSAWNVRAGSSSGSRPGPPAPVLTFTSPPSSSSSSCPAITVESSFTPSPSSPPLPAPALLLDPLAALQSNRGGGSSPSSSGHASSLSPSPRATQSPPKQTLFSPCVDVFEPGPPSWEDEEEQRDEDEEDEDMGADESQYRHRRLTGDSGIEVCRCRVEEEEEEEEEEQEQEQEQEEGGGLERDRKGGADPDRHDSVDCPARGQTVAGEGLTATAAPASEDGGKVVIVMETV